MSTTFNLPSELTPICKLIEKLGYKHNFVTVFDDYLSHLVNFFTPPHQQGFGTDCFKKYTEEERLIFSNLLKETINVFNNQISVKGLKWYDPFGDLYMYLSSKSKASALGQFFTPQSLVDMMVQLQADSKNLTGKGLRVNDPTCGSGRMLIAFHANYPGNYVYGEDIDLICCKMSLINCLMHGCEGEIIHHDALAMNFYRSWKINPNIRLTGLPSLLEVTEKESYFTVYKKPEVSKVNISLPSENTTEKSLSGPQLSIF